MTFEEIIGPVMVGPSSSHTAGAVRLGNMARACLGEDVRTAGVYLRGSFSATGKGHGTDRALIAGLLGMRQDDERIVSSFDAAREARMDFEILHEDAGGAHPNSVRFRLEGVSGKEMEIAGASTGGGAIELDSIDGFSLKASCTSPTLVTFHKDQPGVISAVSSVLLHYSINVASMNVHRQARGAQAVMVMEMDAPPNDCAVSALRTCHPALKRVMVLQMV